MKNVIIEQLSEDEINRRNIRHWPVWEKEVSRFDWHYDSHKQCLIIEGEGVVETPEETYAIKAGDFITFRDGLNCVWDIKKPVKKHYQLK